MTIRRYYIPPLITFTLLLMTPALSSGQVQGTLERGDRVRVTAPSLGLDGAVGTIRDATGDAVHFVAPGSSTDRGVTLSALSIVSVAQEERSRSSARSGLVNGAWLGILVGGIVGFATHELKFPNSSGSLRSSSGCALFCSTGRPRPTNSRFRDTMRGSLIGGAIGGALGWIVGVSISQNTAPLKSTSVELGPRHFLIRIAH